MFLIFLRVVSPTTTHVDPGVKKSVFAPHSQHHAAVFPSTNTVRQSGTKTETEMSGNSAEAVSVTDLHLSPHQFTGRHFIYHQNTPDNRVRPAVQTTSAPQSRLNSHPLIIRKSSGHPFRQSSGFSQVWDHRDAQKSYSEAPTNASPELATHKTGWPLKAGEYWRGSLPALRGHYSGHKETNELSAVRVPSASGGIQSSRFLGFASQTVSRAPSISRSLEASVIKRNPSPEKLTSSIHPDLSSVTGGEAPRPKKVQSYLFKDSQASLNTADDAVSGGRQQTGGLTTMPLKHRLSDAGLQLYSTHASHFIHRKAPVREDDVNPLHFNTSVVQSSTKHQLISTVHPPLVQHSLHPAPGNKGSFAPVSHAASQDDYERSAGGSVHGYELGGSTKSIYGIRGFENLPWPTRKEQLPASSSRRTHSQPYSFNNGKDYKFKISHVHPSLSPKYSFGQRRGSSPTPKPAKLERAPTDYSPPPPSSPPSGFSDLIQTTTVSAPKLFTSGFKDIHPLLPESDPGTGRKPDQREVRAFKTIYRLRGFGTRPLEGAKTLVRIPDTHGSELRSPQIWQPKSSRWSDQTGETGPESISTPTHMQNEQSSAGAESLQKPAGSSESAEGSTFTPEKDKKKRKIYTFLGFQSVRDRIGKAPKETHWNDTERDPTVASPPARRASSAQFRSAGGLGVQSSSASGPRSANTSKPVEAKARLLGASTSSTVRGRRVKGKHINSRQPDRPTPLSGGAVNAAIVRQARVKAVTYADVLGSTSFSSVRAVASTPTPTTPADEGYFPNATAASEQTGGGGHWTSKPDDGGQSRGNTSTSPGLKAEDEVEGFNSAEGKNRENNTEVKGDFDAFLDNEGSGSGAFDPSEVFSNVTTVQLSPKVNEDLFELDYLRLSTENISFKSVKLSHTEK